MDRGWALQTRRSANQQRDDVVMDPDTLFREHRHAPWATKTVVSSNPRTSWQMAFSYPNLGRHGSVLLGGIAGRARRVASRAPTRLSPSPARQDPDALGYLPPHLGNGLNVVPTPFHASRSMCAGTDVVALAGVAGGGPTGNSSYGRGGLYRALRTVPAWIEPVASSSSSGS